MRAIIIDAVAEAISHCEVGEEAGTPAACSRHLAEALAEKFGWDRDEVEQAVAPWRSQQEHNPLPFVPAPVVVAIPIEVAEKLSDEMSYHWNRQGLSGKDAHQAWIELDRAIAEYIQRQKGQK